VLGDGVKRVCGKDAVEGVALQSGVTIDCDTIVLATGIRSNIGLALQSGITVGRGIRVDDELRTSDPCIHAIGECAEHRGLVYGLVEPAYEQARVLAGRLAGDDTTAYGGSVVATNLKVSGVNVFSAGAFMGGDGMETLVLRDEAAHACRKVVIKDDVLVGTVLYGDTSDARWFLDLITSGRSIAAQRDTLLFGRAFAAAA
jgi:nitrite reductase (NADH) large subunit